MTVDLNTLTFICPLCNGMSDFTSLCGICENIMFDAGRLGDYNGDYSPYREIDDLKQTNGFMDLTLNQCLHVFTCSACGNDEIISIDEIPIHENSLT